MKRNVLVFSGGAYPAIQIYYCLKDNLLFNPIAASSYQDHSAFVFDEYYDKLPYVYELDFVDRLNELIIEKNIEFIIPTHDTIALVLMERSEEIKAVIVCSPVETTRLCRYKRATYEFLKRYDFIPKVYTCTEAVVEYPVFSKPDDGQGSQGTLIVDCEDKLKEAFSNPGNVVCEFLNGEEITVDCFTDRHGKLQVCVPRMRSRIMYGISAHGYNIEVTEEIQHIVDTINGALTFRGYWFIQLKKAINGQFKLLEICTRFAGTFGVSKSLSVNLPLLALCDFAGMDVCALQNNYTVHSDKTFIDRYKLEIDYDTVYVDYDDTVTRNGGKDVNVFILAFLYQCREKDKKIVLITRHEATKNESLSCDFERLAISGSLFDKIIEIGWEDEKYKYIDDKSAIFIDNSFTERKKIYDHIGIPVFDTVNWDCLLDWR